MAHKYHREAESTVAIAEESEKTRKARNKLKKQFEKMEQHSTPQALAKKTLEIHRWIARHAHHRVPLKTKSVSLFDENQNTAQISQYIKQLLKKLT